MAGNWSRVWSSLRWAGEVALISGLLVAWRSFPTRRAQDWSAVHGFELDSSECDALREARSTSDWFPPPTLAEPTSIREVARKFRLELTLVCQVNQRSPETCGEETIVQGENRHLTLPLYRETPPRRSRRMH
jgi:hypothetical protein